MADNQITPFQLTDQFTMDNFNQRINETNTALHKKSPAGFGYDGANSTILLLNSISGDTIDDKLTTLFNSMVNESAVQICLSDTSFSGYEMHGTLYKLSDYHGGYATAVFNGYDNYAGIPVTFRKVLREGVWGPYEYFTPPMYIGVEYRTTERYLGKPVYVKTVDFGALPNSTFKSVSYSTDVNCRLIEAKGNMKNGSTAIIPGILGNSDSQVINIGGNENNIWVLTKQDYSERNADILVKYYKTTD